MSQKRKKQRRVASQRTSPSPAGVSLGDIPGAGKPSNLDVIEREPPGGSIRSNALAALADDTGISNSQALAALAGKKSLPTIQAGIVSRMSAEDQKALEAAMAKASKTISGHFAGMEVSSELSERILSAGSTVIGSRLPGVVTVPSTRRTPSVAKEEQPRRKDRQLPAQEQIARRVFKRQRQAVISMLRATGMKTEIEELRSVESKLAKGSKRSCMHAAYSARVLLEGVANHLFPPTTEKWVGRDKREHALGPNDFKNRLIAFVERNLGSQFEGEEFRAFVGTLDLVMRWTGGGPHGSHEPHDAEHLYTRLLDALSVIARAHAAQSA